MQKSDRLSKKTSNTIQKTPIKKIEAFIKKSEKDTDERKHDKETLELNENSNKTKAIRPTITETRLHSLRK